MANPYHLFTFDDPVAKTTMSKDGAEAAAPKRETKDKPARDEGKPTSPAPSSSPPPLPKTAKPSVSEGEESKTIQPPRRFEISPMHTWFKLGQLITIKCRGEPVCFTRDSLSRYPDSKFCNELLSRYPEDKEVPAWPVPPEVDADPRLMRIVAFIMKHNGQYDDTLWSMTMDDVQGIYWYTLQLQIRDIEEIVDTFLDKMNDVMKIFKTTIDILTTMIVPDIVREHINVAKMIVDSVDKYGHYVHPYLFGTPIPKGQMRPFGKRELVQLEHSLKAIHDTDIISKYKAAKETGDLTELLNTVMAILPGPLQKMVGSMVSMGSSVDVVSALRMLTDARGGGGAAASVAVEASSAPPPDDDDVVVLPK